VILVHVIGPATATETSTCALRLSARIAGGGRAITCLTGFRGAPGPNAVVRLQGTITFQLPHRTLRARIAIVDRFAADGKHAAQRVTGPGIAGRGTFAEDPPGHVTASDLRYRLTLG
jgi:hypothetical protein